MNTHTTQEHIRRMRSQGWHLDTHSTILSRRHSAHRCIGNLRFVKPIKGGRATRKENTLS